MNLMPNDMINQRLDRHIGTDDHQNGGENQSEPIHRFNAARIPALEDDQMHPRGEDERRDVVGEVSDNAENVAELWHKPRHQRDQNNLHDTENNISGIRDEVLSLGAWSPMSFHHLVHRLHPQRESTDDRDDHHDVHGHRHPRAVRQRLQNITLYAVS